MAPGWVRQVNGVGVEVGGTGLGVRGTVAVATGEGMGGGEVTVRLEIISFEAEQAESPSRSMK